MASKHIGKTNYLYKNKTHFITYIILFVCILIKFIFLNSQGSEVAMGLYCSIFAFMLCLAFIFSLSIKNATYQIVSYKKARNLYRNSLSYIKISSLISFAIGILVAVLCVIFATTMSSKLFYADSYGAFVIIAFSIAFPFLFMDSAILGSFDAFGYDLPKNAFKIIFSVFDLLLGFLLIFLCNNFGVKHELLLHNSYVSPTYDCIGAALAVSFSVILSTIWLLVLTKVLFNKIRQANTTDASRSIDSFLTQINTYLHSVYKPFFYEILYFIPFMALQAILFVKMANTGETTDYMFVSTAYGKYIYEYLLWFMIPICLTTILGIYSMEYIKKSYAKQDKYQTGVRMLLSTKQFLCLPLPLVCFFGLSIRSLNATFWQEDKTSAVIIAFIAAILYSYSYLIMKFLWGLSKQKYVMITLGVGMIVEIFIFAGVFSSKGNVSVSAILKSNLVYGIVTALLFTIFVRRHFVYKKHLSRHIYMPLVSLIAMIVTVLLVNLIGQISIPVVGVICAFILGFLVHTLSLTILGVAKENEIHEFPQGKLIILFRKILGIE